MLVGVESLGRHTPPGPPTRGTGLRGGVTHAIRVYNFTRDPLAFVADRFRRYGDIYFAPSPDGDRYAIRHPDHIRQVLIDDAASYHRKNPGFRLLREVLGNGLINLDGATWRRHRRMIQPSFSPSRLARYAEAMEDEAFRVAERWRDGDRFDVSQEMMALTLRVVSRTLFSHDSSGDTDRVRRLMTAWTQTFAGSNMLPTWMTSPARRRARRAVDELDELVYGLIDERQSRGDVEGPPDLLQALVTAVDDDGSQLSRNDIRDELMTFYLAGHETTSHALTWTWYLLSKHPHVEAELHAELDSVLTEDRVRFEDLERLEYTEQVISESMRLYPPAYVMARRARQDTKIGDWPIPAGTDVSVWTYMTHHDARWHPDPERFDPDRFSPERRAAMPKLSYLPFGAGARTCIGKRFALVEAKIIIATLARRHRLRLSPNRCIETRPRITLAPKEAVAMRASRR